MTALYDWVTQSIPKVGRNAEKESAGRPSEIVDFYMTMAAVGARSLPEEIDDDLLHAWVAATRTESFDVPQNIETFTKALCEFTASVKEAKEAAEQEGGIELSDESGRVRRK